MTYIYQTNATTPTFITSATALDYALDAHGRVNLSRLTPTDAKTATQTDPDGAAVLRLACNLENWHRPVHNQDLFRSHLVTAAHRCCLDGDTVAICSGGIQGGYTPMTSYLETATPAEQELLVSAVCTQAAAASLVLETLTKTTEPAICHLAHGHICLTQNGSDVSMRSFFRKANATHAKRALMDIAYQAAVMTQKIETLLDLSPATAVGAPV